jgi:16S rRNA (guanine(527)-N(7))-methyltransferase RsmG
VSPGGAPSHREPLLALGLPPEPAAALGAYLDLLAAWNDRVNLTAAGSAAERVALLVAAVAPTSRVPPPGSRLIDVGSGNGSPGLVLALLRPDLRVTLLEPRRKRWAFLREASRAAGRGDVEVRRERHDQYRGDAAETVTLRGLALPLRALRPMVARGGCVLAFGPGPAPEAPFVRAERIPLPGTEAQLFRDCST